MIPVYSHLTQGELPEHLYLSVWPIVAPLLRAYADLPGYLIHASKGVTPEDRWRVFVNARLLLHEMVDQLKLPISNFSIDQDERGKPIGWAHPHPVSVSLSHTPTRIFALLSMSGEVGLDAEPKHRVVHPGLRARMMSEAECESTTFAALSDLQCWVIKESILKLTGDGLRVAMRHVQLQSIQDHTIISRLHGRAIQTRVLELEAHFLAISTYL
jgi:phosphopantetheinyl transferase